MAIRGKETYRNAGATKQEVAGHPCALSAVLVHNDDAAEAFVQIFDKTSGNVTVGTTVPDIVLRVAADTYYPFDLLDIKFDNGVTFAVTTTAEGSSGATANHICFIFV